MENKLHTISIAQNTHYDLVTKSGLRRIFITKSLACGAFIKKFLRDHSGMHLIWSFLFCLPIHWWWDSREAFKKSTSADINWVTWRDRHSDEWTTWIKQSLPQRYVRVECQLNSDQAPRLLCLKGHVRAHDSMLRQYRWQEASEFLCTEIPLFGGSWATKKIT